MQSTLRSITPILTGLALGAASAAGAEEATRSTFDTEATEAAIVFEVPTIPAAPRESARPTSRLFGLDVFALSGSLAEHKLPGHYGYALPWGRGPRLSAERTLGLGWGIRF